MVPKTCRGYLVNIYIASPFVYVEEVMDSVVKGICLIIFEKVALEMPDGAFVWSLVYRVPQIPMEIIWSGMCFIVGMGC